MGDSIFTRNVIHLLVPALLLLAGTTGVLGSTDHAPIMPLARQSLLLDISSAGERIITAGERGHILYSDDEGDTWTQALVPTTQMLTAVHFVDEKRGWSVGHDGLILISDDGGARWRIQRDGIAAQAQANLSSREQAHQKIAVLESELAMASQAQKPELALRLEDALMDLEDADLALREPVFTSPLMDVWFQDTLRGWATGAFGTLLSTRDGGKTWRDDAGLLSNPDEFHLNAVKGDGEGRVFIAGEGGVMFRSLDSGATWDTLPPFYEGSWFGLVHSPAPDALLVFGLRGNLYRSTDFGDTWTVVANSGRGSIAGGSVDSRGRIALVGAVGTILESLDNGVTFERSTLGDRLSLSAAIYRGERLIVSGQGGVKVRRND